LTELREIALDLLDNEVSSWQIMSYCEQFINRKWQLSNATKKEYLEWLRQELKDIFMQHERHRFANNPV
jgi:hypothetical protein